MVFTGHFHSQDIAGRSHGKKKIYDIETGSIVSYPSPYRFVTLQGNRLDIRTCHIESIPGSSDTSLAPYARRFAADGLTTIIKTMLPAKVSEDCMSRVCDVMATAYVAHLAGDEVITPVEEENIKKACRSLRHYSWKYAFILKHLAKNLWTDLPPQDNNLTIHL